MSRAESFESVDRGESDFGGSVVGGSVASRSANGLNISNIKIKFETTQEDEEERTDGAGSIDQIADKGKIALKALQKKHAEALSILILTLKQEMEDCQLSVQARLRDLDESHDLQLQSLRSDHEQELENITSIQEKEIAMEASVHDAELKMLVERRILNSVLDTVVDGIINIDPIGTIRRFNPAAEKMFGYSSAEVLGKNIRDMMPPNYSVEHDSYLTNYLTTGVKKVIGGSRRAFGLKKDGSHFPILLSVSEVKEDGVHLFTGIVRDLTEEVSKLIFI
jgi:PAS domain S-box-containing protein